MITLILYNKLVYFTFYPLRELKWLKEKFPDYKIQIFTRERLPLTVCVRELKIISSPKDLPDSAGRERILMKMGVNPQ
ncbi:hypothetical protein KKE60_08395 [Patescibacteria group bacterium]|nr:hypothetical protein [Patescibacteria group bacterium]